MPKIFKSHSTPYFEKKFARLPKNLQKIVVRKILLFEDNPFHPSLLYILINLKDRYQDFGPFILLGIFEFCLDS